MSIFAVPAYEFFPMDRFTDTVANAELESCRVAWGRARSEGRDALLELRDKWLSRTANSRFGDERTNIIAAACRYLLLAQNLRQLNEEASTVAAAERASAYFHAAANEMRRAGLLDRAAQCYFNSALEVLRATRSARSLEGIVRPAFELGVRSAGRSRSMFDSLGEDDKADNAHVLRLDLERRIRKLERRRFEHALLVVGGALTRYGTSPSRWFITLFLGLMSMALIYWGLASQKAPQPDQLLPALQLQGNLGSNPYTTAIFISVINLFAFGGYTNITPQNWLGEMALLLQALFSFFWLGTGVTFLTRR